MWGHTRDIGGMWGHTRDIGGMSGHTRDIGGVWGHTRDMMEDAICDVHVGTAMERADRVQHAVFDSHLMYHPIPSHPIRLAGDSLRPAWAPAGSSISPLAICSLSIGNPHFCQCSRPPDLSLMPPSALFPRCVLSYQMMVCAKLSDDGVC